MSPQFAVDLKVALDGTRVDDGESVHCSDESCNGRFHEGAPVAVVTRFHSTGWDIEEVIGPAVRADGPRWE